MIKSVLRGIVIGLIGWLIFSVAFIVYNYVPSRVNSDLEDSFKATCRITVGDSKGTGVLLNTGYIITAAHVVDHDGDGKADKDKALEIEFFDSKVDDTAEIVLIGKTNEYDFAIIKPSIDVKSSIQVSDKAPKYGDKLYTIGMTKGFGPLITDGYQSWPSRNSTKRASVFVHEGNSGGGIFNEDQELCGIVSQTISSRAMAPVRVTVAIPLRGGRRRVVFGYGEAMVLDHIAAWCEYVDSDTFISVLKKKNLMLLIEEQREPIVINRFYIQMLLQIIGVLFCAFWLRKNLFR